MKKRNLLLFLMLLVLNARAVDVQDINPKKFLLGFKYSQRDIALDGRQNIWDVRLYPNGKFEWRGNHLGSNEACSKTAGQIIQNLTKETRIKATQLALESAKEQKALKLASKPSSLEYRNGASLGVEYGKEYVLSQINSPHTSKMENFKKEMLSILNNVIDKKNSKARMLELTSSIENGVIIARIKNIGVLPTRVSTSKKAAGSFYLQNLNKREQVIYFNKSSKRIDKLLKSGESIEIKLKADIAKVSEKWKLVFQNQFNRPIKNKIKVLNVTLCDNLKVKKKNK
ncbi:MAG: hypothetical protein HN576_04930 [Bacteriovoracaceae bacterium]|nr:hypothetical protein [Bacteriovoracaceae bacterium]